MKIFDQLLKIVLGKIVLNFLKSKISPQNMLKNKQKAQITYFLV